MHAEVIVSASCGHEPGRVVEYKPLLDAAIDLATHKPSYCVVVQREAVQAKLVDGRDIEWHRRMRALLNWPRFRFIRLTFISFIHLARPDSRKVWCVIMEGMLWR